MGEQVLYGTFILNGSAKVHVDGSVFTVDGTDNKFHIRSCEKHGEWWSITFASMGKLFDGRLYLPEIAL